MCVPKAPKVDPVPIREAARLPDNGDPLVRESTRRQRLSQQSMIFAGGNGTLGIPSVTSRLGSTGVMPASF